jgi:hypothetical protein
MNTENKQPTLPYVSYPTFKEFIRHLHDTVVTDQIDNTMMPSNFSGSARAAVTSTLKSLNLIDNENNTTQKLKDLAKAYDSKDWPTAVRNYILSAYGDITKGVDLKSVTRKQVDEMFGDTTSQMKDKCVRFFLSANKEAGVEYSPHLKIRRRLPKKQTGVATPKKTATGKGNIKPQKTTPENELTPSGMFDQTIPIESDSPSFIRVPKDITTAQVELVKAIVEVIAVKAKQNESN